MDREQFLAERANIIGGSDAHHLLGLPPYGCERRLWYDKKQIPADFPFTGNIHTTRGHWLETVAAEFYASQHKVALEKPQSFYRQGFSFVGAHLDFLERRADREGDGVCEIKCPTVRTFMKIRAEGASPEHEVQLQWNMMASGLAWGTLVYVNFEVMRCLPFTVDADLDMQGNLRHLGEYFWRSLGQADNPYDLLADGDPRCLTCPWRTTCRGLGATPSSVAEEEEGVQFQDDESFANLVEDYLIMRAQRQAAEASLDEISAELKRQLAGRRISTSRGRVWLAEWTQPGYTVKPGHRKALKVIPARESLGDGEP